MESKVVSYLILELLLDRPHLFEHGPIFNEPLDAGVVLDALAERLAKHQVRQVGHVVQHL